MVLLLSSVVLAGCGDNSGAGAVNLAPDQNVTVAIAREFGSLDPARLTSQADADVAGNLFNGVVRVSSVGGAVVPDLAVALPDLSSDGRTYTFHLRRGVNFSNGDPLTAGDFVYSWSRVAALQGPDAAIFSDVVGYSATVSGGAAGLAMSGLVAKGDLTLEVHLAAPQGYLLDRLASVAAAVVDRKVIASAGDPLGRGANQNWANQPSTEVGTGPYRLAARAANSADFSPVAGWWGDPKPVVRRLRLVVTPASSDPITAFIADSYDLVGYAGMEHLSVDALTRVRQGPSQELTTVARGAFTWVGFNHKQGPFAGLDPPATKLRHAFALALDRTKIGSALCHDSGTCLPATGGPVPPGMRGYTGDESDPLATFDPGQARSLLKQADPDGSATKKLAIAFADTPENGAIFQFLQDQWQKNLGVRVEPLVPHSASSAGPGTAALVIQRWQARYDDPQQLLDGYFATSAGPTGGGFSDPQFDKLAAKGDGEPAASSLGTYATAISRLQTDAAYVPLYYDSGNLLVGAHVVGAAMGTLADGPWSSLEVLQ
jgi:oligopeptide transport system substrate-binding protein